MRTGLAAAALIICISMGYMARSRMKDRADKLNALCAEIRTLGDSMELSQYRLSEMLDRLGGELWREYTAALTGEQLGAGEAWAATVRKEADGGSLSGLDKQDIAALITLGEAFSSISRAAQADHARLTLRQMEVRAADAEKALTGKGKLYSTLGVLAGFAGDEGYEHSGCIQNCGNRHSGCHNMPAFKADRTGRHGDACGAFGAGAYAEHGGGSDRGSV